MRVPQAFRTLYKAPGALVTAGVGLIALVLAGLTYGWKGVAATLVAVLILAFLELWRSCIKYEAERDELLALAAAGQAASRRVEQLDERVQELEDENQALLQRSVSPAATFEALLGSVGGHLNVISVVEKHRALRTSAPDAPVTSVGWTDSGAVVVTANCAGNPDLLIGEPVVFVHDDEQVSGLGYVESANESQVFGEFAVDGVPPAVLAEMERVGSFTPTGYALKLAGLAVDFDKISDGQLVDLKAALEGARTQLHRALQPGESTPLLPESVDSEDEEVSGSD